MFGEFRPNCGSLSLFKLKFFHATKINDSRIDGNMKVAWDDSAVKLACCD